MLELAYHRRDELAKLMTKSAFDERYKFYHVGNYVDYTYEVASSNWSELAYCSVKDDKVIGFFKLHLDRVHDKGDGLVVINFGNKNDIVFSRDFRKFLISIFVDFKVRKMEFNVIVGNPIEKMYDRFVEKYGGRYAGTRLKAVKLLDQEYYDLKMYEIMREDVLRRLK